MSNEIIDLYRSKKPPTKELVLLTKIMGKNVRSRFRGRKDRSVTVLPGVYTGRSYSYFLQALAEDLHALSAQHSIGENRLTRYNFPNILQLAGYPMSPMGSPAYLKRESNIDNEALELYKLMVEDYTSGFTHGLSMSIAKGSSTSVPFFSKDLEYKASLVHYWAHNVDQICEAFKEGGMIGLMNLEMPITPFFSTNYRVQGTDNIEAVFEGGVLKSSIPKSRAVENWLGEHVVANRMLPKGFAPTVHRVRSRVVWGLSSSVNYAFGAIAAGFRDYAVKNVMKEVLHHTDVKESLLELKGAKRIAAWDITRFDHSIRAQLQLIWAQRYREIGIRSELCDIIEHIIHGSAIFGPDYPDEVGFNTIGYPLKDDVYAPKPGEDLGLQSGVWWVSDVGKVTGMWIPMWSFYKRGVIKDFRDREARMKFYRNEYRDYMIYKGAGDDTAAGEFKDGAIEAVIEDSKDLGFVLDVEDEVSFLGWTVIQESGQIFLRPNLVTGLSNFLVPERSIGKPGTYGPRQYWAWGIRERNEHYNQHPLWEEVWNVTLDRMSNFFNQDFRYIINKNAAQQEQMINKVTKLDSVYDRMFLVNPDYIHYRFMPGDVSPDLLRDQFLVIDPDTVSQLISNMGLSRNLLR